MLEIACLVDAGIRAPNNDDRVSVNNRLVSQGSYSESVDANCLVIVCDGVGGAAYGNEAAEIVTGIFSSLSGIQLTTDDISENIIKTNEAVLTAQKKDSQHSKMSTTIAGLYINGDDFIAFNIGDSRIYRYRSPYIMQISTDHSVRQEQLDMGLKPKPGQENIITGYIGGTKAVPNIIDGTGRVFSGDVYILCSDGVWGVLKNDDFEKILAINNNYTNDNNDNIENNSLEEMCQTFVSLALQNGSKDNVSIIIVRRS